MATSLLAASDINVAQNIGFYVIAAAMILAALLVVSTKNVVHAALWLVVVMSGFAAQYVLAAAEFVAVSQVLVYVGAVMVLFLFGIMLTRAQIGAESDLNNKGAMLGVPVALLLLGLMSWAIIDAFGDDTLLDRPTAFGNPAIERAFENGATTRDLSGSFSTEAISDQILSPYLAPFIAVTFVLLAAAIGAIVLARKD